VARPDIPAGSFCEPMARVQGGLRGGKWGLVVIAHDAISLILFVLNAS
jgi:hypothetical protein